MPLGKIGVWIMPESQTTAGLTAYARHAESLGYSALWIAEAVRNAVALAAWLLAHTETLNIATGIANIYARDAAAALGAREALAEASNGRFILGLGVSHRPVIQNTRGHEWARPVAAMRAYLEAMARIPYGAPPPATRPLTLLAALGPQMLALARDLADGAHPYNAPPEHTAIARDILGPEKILAVEQKVLLESDPAAARAAARQLLAPTFALTNYTNHWRRLGFTDADFAAAGSDRLVDALVAWGDEAAIKSRIDAQFAAGASHVCIQPVSRAAETLTRLAPVLL